MSSSSKKVIVKVSSPRRLSESSSKSSLAKSSKHLHAPSEHSHHSRGHTGHRLEIGSRRRSYSWQGHPIEPKIELEPTYQLEPTEKIAVAVLEKMMEREMKDLLHGLNYSVTEAPNWSKVLSERLKSEAKKLMPNRYKLVASVVIAPKTRQSILSSSRCLWETEHDTVINSLYEDRNLIAIITCMQLNNYHVHG
ncbi:TCTEX1D4 [Bugula neritina]|uniref:TCTEX1D4 n=1 Tax=Bugula neritina TaxID=10212 RepID=A0A7J7IY51_BUGNE|nr:TCTEX1D4 [Bugula neritina]